MTLFDHSALLAVTLLLLLVGLGLLLRYGIRQRRWLQARVDELETLGQVGRALVAASFDLQALYEFIYQQVGVIIDTSTFQLGLLEGNSYHIAVWYRDGECQEPAVFDISDGEGLVAWVAAHKEALLVTDYEAEWESLPAHPRYLSEQTPPRSAVFVPLITGGESIGILAAQSHKVGAFTQDDLRRLSIVANQAASAIANARLYRQAQTRAAQLELVNRISRQVRALLPLADLFEQVVHLIQSTFGYYCVSIYGFDQEQEQIRLRASTVIEMFHDTEELRRDRGLILWALTHKETVLVNDVTTDTRYLYVSALPETRAELVVPLIIEDQVLGALDVQSDRADAFGPEDKFAMEALAGQLALALQESRLYNAERQQRLVAETLLEVSQTLTSSLELEVVLHAILSDLRRVLIFDAAEILLLEDEDRVVIRAAQGLPEVVEAQGQSFPLADSDRLQRLAESDRPIIFDCADDDQECYHTLLHLPPNHACLGARLIAREELIGFLTVDALPPQNYHQEDVAVIAAFAGQAAVAIDNARLYTSQREQAWVATALLRMAEETSKSTDLDQVLDAITRMTVSLVDVERCGVLLLQEEPSQFRGAQLASKGADLGEEFRHLVLQADAWAPLRGLQERPHPIILGGGEVLTALPDDLFDYFGLSAWLLLLPLVSKGKLIGVMLVAGGSSDIDVMRNRVRLISGIASQAAMAIENAQLYSAQQEEAYVNIVLLQVAEAVNSLAELNDILLTITRLAPILVGVEQCVVLRWHAGMGAFSVGPSYGLTPSALEQLQDALDKETGSVLLDALQVAREPLESGEGYLFPMPAGWSGVFANDSLQALPLTTRRELVGGLLVSLPGDGVKLGVRLKNILTGIAHQASTAIENDLLYGEALERERMERELEVAQEIQSSFLPGFRPQEPGWSVGSFWRAARQVGGDFYDFFQPSRKDSKQVWGVVVADVADKGVPAALYMALSRTLIRTVGFGSLDPAATLERVNDLLLNDSRSDLFVTVIYALWEPAAGRLVYANAGHNPPLCVRAHGAVEILTENNIVLGVIPKVSMDRHTISLKSGEVVVFYTDGVTDALNESEEEFGLQRLINIACLHRHQTAEEIVEAIQDAVDEFAGQTPQFDDLTLVVIKRD